MDKFYFSRFTLFSLSFLRAVSDSEPLDKYIMASRFEGVLSTFLAKWKYFKTVENPNILVINVSNDRIKY